MEHEQNSFEPEEVELDDDLEALAAEDLDSDYTQEPDDEELRRFMGS
jgi:hypothetical protein